MLESWGGRGRESRAGSPQACQGHHGAQQGLLCGRDPPSNPLSLRKQQKTGHGSSPTFPTENVGAVISGTRGKGQQPPRHRAPTPARAWLSCYCSPAGGQPTQRRYNVKIPRAALDRISVLGTCDRPTAPSPGSLYLERPGARGRANAETGQGPVARRTRPSAQPGLRAHRPPRPPKGLWEL